MINILSIGLLVNLLACKNPLADVPVIDKVPIAKPGNLLDWGEIDLDELGSPRLRVVLALDYIPKGKKKPRYPRCLKPFDSKVELGIARCVEGAKTEERIRADQVLQTCYTSSSFPDVAPKVPLRMPGCRLARILSHKFSPGIRLDFEPR